MVEIAPCPTPVDLERDLEAIHAASWGWALVCCRWDREAAEEVLQSAYLKALDGRARFDGQASPRTWFFGVVRYTAAEWRRATRIRRLVLARWVVGREPSPAAPSVEAVAEQTQTRDRLRRLLSRLSTRQRELLHLVFYQELTVEEAAGVLGITVGSARTHYARGKERLRTLLESPEDRS